MFCIMPNVWKEVDNNYFQTARNYESKKQLILERINQETNQSGQEFINKLQSNYEQLMTQKYTSELTGRDVNMNTILKHVYDAAQKMVEEVLNNGSGNVLEQINALKMMSQENKKSTKEEQRQISKQLKTIVDQYQEQINIDNLMMMLPDYVSNENKQLSASQIYAYTRSRIKRTIQEKTAILEIEKVVQRHPSIIMGYVREDAITQAALLAIQELQSRSMHAKTVGNVQSSIDVVISLSGGASKIIQKDGEIVKDIMKQLDSFSTSFVVQGESQYNAEEFLGIQSKPWDLNKSTTSWNVNEIGSRANLLKDFQLENIFMDPPTDLIGWHRGVLFLSQRLEQVIGPNTVMYATGRSLTWTSDLLNDLVNVYHKYFAFMVTDNKLQSKIQLADHYG